MICEMARNSCFLGHFFDGVPQFIDAHRWIHEPSIFSEDHTKSQVESRWFPIDWHLTMILVEHADRTPRANICIGVNHNFFALHSLVFQASSVSLGTHIFSIEHMMNPILEYISKLTVETNWAQISMFRSCMQSTVQTNLEQYSPD